MKDDEFYARLNLIAILDREKMLTKIRHRFENPSDAEDAVQEALTRALEYRAAYQPSYGNLEKWVGRILWLAVFQTVNFYRSRGLTSDHWRDFRKRGIRFTSYQPELSYEDVPELEEIRDRINTAILKESKKHQPVLACFFLHGLRTADIIKLIPYSKKNVNMILFRFKKKLEEALSEPRTNAV